MEQEDFDLFISVNPDLKTRSGHPYHLDCALREAAGSAGLEFVSFGNHEQDEAVEALEFVRPVFSKTAWEVFDWGTAEIVAQHVDEFVQALEQIREKKGEGARLLVYWYMGSVEVFRAITERSDDFGDTAFCLHLFSGFFLEPSSFTTAHLLHAGTLLEQIQESRLRYEVVSDSEKLLRDLKEVTGASCDSVPAFASQKLKLADRETSAEKITVVYPTDDSSRRGFELWIEFLKSHAARYGEKIDFKVRLFPGNRKGIRELLDGLSDNIEIIEGELSEKEFQSLLVEADIVVLPYLRELFYYRTSSILYEAWALKKPVVVVDDTWLSDSVRTQGGGWIVEDSEDSLKQTFDSIVSGGKSSIEDKSKEISPVPQVEDLVTAILSLPYDGLENFSFRHQITSEEVERYYRSEKEKVAFQRELDAAGREIARLQRKTDWLESELHRIVNSKTWRYTEFLRGWAESFKEWRRGKKAE